MVGVERGTVHLTKHQLRQLLHKSIDEVTSVQSLVEIAIEDYYGFKILPNKEEVVERVMNAKATN